ncbi:MAG TPA: Xaa-Pro dipeptidase [Gammaproteobacteria bacterium]
MPIAMDDDLRLPYSAHLDTLSQRLEQALGAAGLDALCVFAGAERYPARDDVPYPFRVEPYFKAFVPLVDAAGSVLVLAPARRPRLIYLQPDDYWHAPPKDPEGFWTDFVDVRIARDEAEVSSLLRDLPPRTGAIGDPGAAADRFASIDDQAVLRVLDFHRAYKTSYEVACLERASAIAVRGHRAAAAAFAADTSEFDLHQRYCDAAGQRESELPYNAIVAVDRHAAVLHYQRLDRRAPERASTLLIDAGASFLGYGSDITRTTVRHAAEFAALRDSIDAMQRTLCRELRAGVDFIALNERAHELLASVLVEHGIVRCGADEAFEHGVTRTFLPHGLGHLLGLQVHDVGGRQISPDGEERPPPPEHPFLRLTRTVEAGFVVTIEPGVYFIPTLLRTMAAPNRARVDWDAVERLLPYGGIRIEDDVLVEPAGVKNLTREAFAAVQP